MARPIGPLARRILARLAAHPSTAAQLADAFKLPVREVVVSCYKLRVAGRIFVTSTVREGGSWRPVAVYSTQPPRPWVPSIVLHHRTGTS
ncbi:hypothetical protein [Achromobacter sp. UBA2119]|uniref:hypothetical protein n=1 Tax=Achromobacter sp. UBA2119 TaxID=1945911 RepID=UPI00257A9D1A|nr:hypothetical protein [Achromobacter sp. UBA2119]